MKAVKFLEGEKIYLRPLEEQDINLVYWGKNNSDVRETLFLFEPLSKQTVQNQLLDINKSADSVLFTICKQADNEAVGQTALVRIDYISRACVFYLAIYGSQFWSQGFGGEATQLMIKYAFDILNLNRIHLHVSSENEKGIAAYKKAGFTTEGTLRQAMYHHNKYIDFLVMGILREEYYKP